MPGRGREEPTGVRQNIFKGDRGVRWRRKPARAPPESIPVVALLLGGRLRSVGARNLDGFANQLRHLVCKSRIPVDALAVTVEVPSQPARFQIAAFGGFHPPPA